MIGIRRTYRLPTGAVAVCDRELQRVWVPLYTRFGGRCVGRWLSRNRGEVVEWWQYPDDETWRQGEWRALRRFMEERKQTRAEWLREKGMQLRHESLTPLRGGVPRHIISVFGVVTNDQGELLLVRTFWRGETWEPPGGQVEEGEALDVAVKREIREETGLEVEVAGVSGVYQNLEVGNVAIGFRARVISGQPSPSPETQEVAFFPPGEWEGKVRWDRFRLRLKEGLEREPFSWSEPVGKILVNK
ncbi:NUDIX hydrolase [Desmospora profundinema]|uniref:ADP-ribose pyrophosphatase YjhB (NUDIX family) n=1 Tax=Desmospora profundinema TaxID=1571184 RepID=A0ABU1IRI0_9BACL|nr:NUDIX hydrolase [Desmospora profundinema]MDR6227152.1 ADP-ribose pyrophosphatase YjhB (NUDIX family) [Desmospora profundinema]